MFKEPAFPRLENTRGSISFHIPTRSTTNGHFLCILPKDEIALLVDSPLHIPPSVLPEGILFVYIFADQKCLPNNDKQVSQVTALDTKQTQGIYVAIGYIY